MDRIFTILVLMGWLGVNAQVERNGDTSMPRLEIQRTMVYTPTSSWLYNHHASIVEFKGRVFAMWSDGMKDEDASGQRVVYAFSRDLLHWTPTQVLAIPGMSQGDTANVLTAAGFYTFGDSLVAYYGEYSPKRQHTHLWAKVSGDGLRWSEARDMHVPVNPNHGPQEIVRGDGGRRLVISGNFSFPYTDDMTGLSGWKMSSWYPDSLYNEDNPATFYAPAARLGLPPLCEGSFFQTDDRVLHMMLRVTGKGWKGLLWLTESKDAGEHWSMPTEAAFTDNDSKFHFGRLPDGRFYYVGIPDTLHHYARTALVLSTSSDGKRFSQSWLVADEPYTMKQEGLWKGGQYGYPHTMIYQGWMYIIVSRQKEAIEVLRFPLRQLQRVQ